MHKHRVLQLANLVLSNRPTSKVSKALVKAKVYRRKTVRRISQAVEAAKTTAAEVSEKQNSEGSS